MDAGDLGGVVAALLLAILAGLGTDRGDISAGLCEFFAVCSLGVDQFTAHPLGFGAGIGGRLLGAGALRYRRVAVDGRLLQLLDGPVDASLSIGSCLLDAILGLGRHRPDPFLGCGFGVGDALLSCGERGVAVCAGFGRVLAGLFGVGASGRYLLVTVGDGLVTGSECVFGGAFGQRLVFQSAVTFPAGDDGVLFGVGGASCGGVTLGLGFCADAGHLRDGGVRIPRGRHDVGDPIEQLTHLLAV